MEGHVSVHSRKYVGKGVLRFDNSAPLDCHFEFLFRNDGKSKFEGVLYVTNDNCNTILGLLYAKKVPIASFEGNDQGNGKIIINKMGLDAGDIHGSALGLPNDDKYKIRDDLLTKIVSVLGAEQHIESFRNLVFTSRLTFLLLSQVIITYKGYEDSDIITAVHALSNFQFGPTKEPSDALSPNIETFGVNMNDVKLIFERRTDYSKLISQSAFNRNPDITCTATMDIMKSNADRSLDTLNKICMLLSFSNGNWITPIYTDYLKEGTIIRTIFHNNKTYRFNNSRYLIDPKSLPYTSLIDFLTKSYKKYDNLVKDFRIHKVIEYYISAHVNSIQQEKFAVGYIALEVLCSAVPDYATNKGEEIEIKAIKETRGKLSKVFEDLELDISCDQLERITNETAYKKVTIKDAQRYLLKDLSIEIDENLIKKLYNIRNKLYHGVDYDSNYEELSDGMIKLFDLLDRIILSMFGLKGIKYLSKILNYKQKEL